MSAWRKLFTVTLPALVAACLIAGVAVEAWVRATWDPRKGSPGFFLSDPVRGQRLAANYTGWFAGVPVHINSLELRDNREYPLAKHANTFRILVLGDSVTFGHGSVYEHTYPYLLEQHLKAWRPDVDWQVWNAAVPGYNTSQELAHLREVGPKFQPDLVIVGFFDNDLIDNRYVPPPGPVKRAAYRVLAAARRHVYSFELYKRIVLTLAWRLSASNDYRLRVEAIGSEESLLSRVSDASTLPEQRLTPFHRLTDDEISRFDCRYGMKPNPNTIPAMTRDPGFPAWVEAVRGFQRLAREGQYRIVFFLNDTPAVCGTEPSSDFFYDGGTRAVDRFYLDVLGQGVPAFSTYDAFMHVRPSEMPGAAAHSIGNANEVKAEALFAALTHEVLPPLVHPPSKP